MCRAKHNGGRRCTQHRAYQAVSNSRRRIQRGETKLEELNKLEEKGEDVAEKKAKLEAKLERDRKTHDADVAHYYEAAYGMSEDETLGDEDRVPAAASEPTPAAEAPAKEEKTAEPERQEVRVDENTEGAVPVGSLGIGDKVSYYSNVKIGTSAITNPDGTETAEEHWHETKFSGEVIGRRKNVGGLGYDGFEVRDSADGTSHYLNHRQHVVLDEKAPEVEEAPAAPAVKEETKAPKTTKKTASAKSSAKKSAPAAAPVVADTKDEDFGLDADEPDLTLEDDSVDTDLDFDEWAKKEGFSDILDDEDTYTAPATGGNPLFDDDEDEDLGYGDDTQGWG